MVEFAYNIIYFSTQQTPLFANHGLHPKFDIQGVNNIVSNLVAKDWAMWLANIKAQLVSNLEEAQRCYVMRMPMNIIKTNQLSRLKIKFGFNNKTSRQLGFWRN